MHGLDRRKFLKSAAAAAALPVAAQFDFLAPLSRLAAADTTIDPGRVRSTPAIEGLVQLIRSTPRARCIPVFIDQLRAGLSYHDFLSALFLATIEHGDPHQVAGVYSAHRISSEARPEERLLPLFWALDRIVGGFEEEDRAKPAELKGVLPRADAAAEVLRRAMVDLDPEDAERAVIVHARSRGPRQAMSLLWEFGTRRTSGTLGHHPIMTANTWRTLDALGWQHAEPVLRYLARSFATNESDRTYLPNIERARKALQLPADWASSESDRGATLELYHLLRQGSTDAACDLVCAQLSSGRVRTGAAWDAVHLVAADLLFRYRTGGSLIGGYLIHAVTATNALRCAFDHCGDDRVKLLSLLQAVGILGDLFVATGRREEQLREVSLLDLKAESGKVAAEIADVFAMLPGKVGVPAPEPEGARGRSDEASRIGFALLQAPASQLSFQRTTRSLLCLKATRNPHDFKYPVAAFEDATSVSPSWRPHLLAASIHALHGPASADSITLLEAREALK